MSVFCLGDGEVVCRRHGRGAHSCGEYDGFAPVVNSPRMGRVRLHRLTPAVADPGGGASARISHPDESVAG